MWEFFPRQAPFVRNFPTGYTAAYGPALASRAMTPPASLLNALRQLLRPLVRLLTAQAITFPMLPELLKHIYVDEAVRHFGLGGEPPSDSRVSLLTGVHRKDVRRLRQS